MDMLDQQLLLAQYNEARRNARPQPQVHRQTGRVNSKLTRRLTPCLCTHTHTMSAVIAPVLSVSSVRVHDTYLILILCFCVRLQGGLLQWTRLFPSLRQRGQNRPPVQPRPQAQTQQSTQAPLLDNSPVAEEQVGVLWGQRVAGSHPSMG